MNDDLIYKGIIKPDHRRENNKSKEVLECIKSLSRIDGLTMALGGLNNRKELLDNIDLLMAYFEKEIVKC